MLLVLGVVLLLVPYVLVLPAVSLPVVPLVPDIDEPPPEAIATLCAW